MKPHRIQLWALALLALLAAALRITVRAIEPL
jgi:MYXO-CTERM domain-containing protein